MEPMKITFLGTGAPLAPQRAGLGLLLEAPGCDPLLLDTCGGFELFRRLGRSGVEPTRVHHALLSHRHGDHIGGVMALAIAVSPLHLYGPPDALEAAESLFGLTYPELSAPGREHHPVEPGRSYRIAGFDLEFFAVEHRVPTLAVRVRHGDRLLAYSADSLPCEALVDCARGADLFVCDALCGSEDRPDAARNLMHPTAREAAEMARRAGVERLALVHLARYADPAAMRSEAQAHFGGEILVPDDLDVIELR